MSVWLDDEEGEKRGNAPSAASDLRLTVDVEPDAAPFFAASARAAS